MWDFGFYEQVIEWSQHWLCNLFQHHGRKYFYILYFSLRFISDLVEYNIFVTMTVLVKTLLRTVINKNPFKRTETEMSVKEKTFWFLSTVNQEAGFAVNPH